MDNYCDWCERTAGHVRVSREEVVAACGLHFEAMLSYLARARNLRRRALTP